MVQKLTAQKLTTNNKLVRYNQVRCSDVINQLNESLWMLWMLCYEMATTANREIGIPMRIAVVIIKTMHIEYEMLTIVHVSKQIQQDFDAVIDIITDIAEWISRCYRLQSNKFSFLKVHAVKLGWHWNCVASAIFW